MDWESLVGLGFVIVLFGVLLMILGVALAASKGGEGEFGGVIIIGPIPIVFGSSTRAALLAAVLGAILMVLAIIMVLLARRPPA